MEKENSDPDWEFYRRGKSHASSYYKQTPGVCTNTRQELSQILRTTNNNQQEKNPNLYSEKYWLDPSTVLSDRRERGDQVPKGRKDGDDQVVISRRDGGDQLLTVRMGGDHLTDAAHEIQAIYEVDQEMLDLLEDADDNELPGKKRKRKRNKNRGNKKKAGNLNRFSDRELQREIERNNKQMNEKVRVENLKQTLGNPWDKITFDEKKQFALHFYYSQLQVFL